MTTSVEAAARVLPREQSRRFRLELVRFVAGMVAVAAIATYQYLGQVLRAQTAAIAKELAGEDGTQESRVAKSAAQSAKAEAKRKSLSDFTGNSEKITR